MRAVTADGWSAPLDPWSTPDAVAVDVGADGLVHVFVRGPEPVLVFDAGGTLVRSWGAGRFASPHGVHVAPDGHVWCVDVGRDAVECFTPDGELVRALARSETPAWGVPFSAPTDVCVLADGTTFVTDGYGNAHVHRFSADGALERTWGAAGDGPGALRVPHAILPTPDEQRLLVADRENHRIQIYDLDGGLLDSWTDFARPTSMAWDAAGRLWVAELGDVAGRLPSSPPIPASPRFSRCSVVAPDGTVLARVGGADPARTGSFWAAHGIAVGGDGGVYVGEVGRSLRAAGAPDDPLGHGLQKLMIEATTPEEGSS